MLEILLTFFFILLIVNIAVFWLKFCLFVILLLLLFPGVYAMFKGAPFIPTNRKAIAAMLKLGEFTENDRVVDIGCGDGRVIRAVALQGVKSAIGYELSVPTYLLAKFRSFLAGGDEEIKFGNFWRQDFSKTDVIVCFLLIDSMAEFEKKIWPKLKKGTRVISNVFRMKGEKEKACLDGVHLYIKK